MRILLPICHEPPVMCRTSLLVSRQPLLPKYRIQGRTSLPLRFRTSTCRTQQTILLLLSLHPLLSTCMIQRKTSLLTTGQTPSPKLKTREKTFATTSRQATRLTLPSTCKAQEQIFIKLSLQSPPQLNAVHQNNLY